MSQAFNCSRSCNFPANSLNTITHFPTIYSLCPLSSQTNATKEPLLERQSQQAAPRVTRRADDRLECASRATAVLYSPMRLRSLRTQSHGRGIRNGASSSLVDDCSPRFVDPRFGKFSGRRFRGAREHEHQRNRDE